MNEIIRTSNGQDTKKKGKKKKKKRDVIARYETIHCPKILKELEKVKALSWAYRTIWSRGHQYHVMGHDGQFVVDKNQRTCTCRR